MLLDTALDVVQLGTVGAPASGRDKLYSKSDDGFYTLDSASGERKLVSSAVAGTDYNSNIRAGFNVTGGGSISITSNRIKWSTRFIVISHGKGTSFAQNGYFDITMPAVGTVITNASGTTVDTVTSNGISLTSWQALYYILPTGLTSGSVAANFRIVGFSDPDYKVPDHWVLVALCNGDGAGFRLCTGMTMQNGQTITAADPLPQYQSLITTGTTSQYFRGDKTWQTLNPAALGITGVDYIGGANKLTTSYTMGGQLLNGTITAGTETTDGPYKSNGTTGDNVTAIKIDAGTAGAGWRIFEIDTPGYWTYSFWYRRRSSQGTDVTFAVDLCDQGSKNFTATSTWQRGFVTVDVTSVFNGTYRFVDISLAGVGGINLYEPMLERGQIASAYTPTETELSDASIIKTGVLAPARLGSGTANGAYYLRGDGAWAVTNSVAVGLGNVNNLTQVDLVNNQTVGGAKTFTTLPVLNQPMNTAVLLGYWDITSVKMPLYHDRIRFSSPTYEVSADGTTWSAGTGGRNCLQNRSDNSTDILDTARYVRWTWNDTSMQYSSIANMLLKFGYVPSIPTLTVTYTTSPDGTTWTTRATGTVTYPSAVTWQLRTADPSSDQYHRIIIQAVGGASSGTVVRINGLELQTPRWGDQGSGPERELPYGWDYDRNMIAYNTWYPSGSFTLGKSTNRWSTIYGANLDVTGTVTGVTKTHIGLSNVPNLDMSNLSNAASGTVPNGRLPTRLQDYNSVNVVTDANTITASGFYYVSNASGSNLPAGITSGFIDMSAYSSTYASQVLVCQAVDQMFFRKIIAGSWTSWVRIIDKTYGDTVYAAFSHTHAASDVTSGIFATARLGSGSPTSAHYLRGDGTWQVLNAAAAAAEPILAAGTSAQYYRGDKIWSPLNPTAVGLSNVPNVDMTNVSNALSGTLPAARHSSLAAISGSVASTGNITASGQKITDLADGVNTTDVVNKAQMDAAIAAMTPAGQELGYAARTTAFTTTNVTMWSTAAGNVISSFSVTVTGTGRPVEIEFYTPQIFHSVAGTLVGCYLIVNGGTNNSTSQLMLQGSPLTSVGPSMIMTRRLVLTNGTSYTFTVGMAGLAAGTSGIVPSTSAPAHLVVTQR